LEDHAPRLASPNAVAEIADAIGQESGGTGGTKDVAVGRERSDGVAGEISENETDNQTIEKPLGEILANVDRAGGKDGDGPHGSFLVFVNHCGRFHFFVSAIGKNV